MAVSLSKRRLGDKILLSWFIIGYLGGIAGVRFGAERYYFTVIVPAFLIFVARFIAILIESSFAKRVILKKDSQSLGIVALTMILFQGLGQLIEYYYKAPQDLEECRYNSYGCRETAEYLSRIPDIKDYDIRDDVWMESLRAYLSYFLYKDYSPGDFFRKDAKRGFFIIWAPQSHPEDYRKGELNFHRLAEYVNSHYPGRLPEKAIFYPNGLPAINIFRYPNEK
ncbi:MAG: hypothetical protein NT033_09370 [Candidatus Omnitrophica bacterium]|nr:hypothetical protein [Candidatus Omnitrophota bacterium]